MHMDAIQRFADVPRPPIARERLADRVARCAGDDVHLVASRRPGTAMLVRPVGRRIDLGRKVVGEEQEAHGS